MPIEHMPVPPSIVSEVSVVDSALDDVLWVFCASSYVGCFLRSPVPTYPYPRPVWPCFVCSSDDLSNVVQAA